MTDLDDLPGRLRSQMLDATAADVARPDLLDRVHRSASRHRSRNIGALAVLVAIAGLAVAALPAPGSSPEPEPERLAGPQAADAGLSVVRADGGQLSISVTIDGQLRTERVELPGYVRNNGTTPITLLGMSVPGTDLQADFPGQALAPGGKRPLSLTRVVDCTLDPSLPSQLDLRVAVLAPAGSSSVLLPVPEEVMVLYRQSHACSQERRAADDAEARAAEAARREAEEARREAEQAAQAGAGG